MSSNGKNYSIPEHKKPILVDKIDFNDEKKIENILQEFEKNAILKEIETACVITKKGNVYKCEGTKNQVFPDDLGEELIGAIVSHNHPINETQYSFSDEDLNLFLEYKLKKLRGVDELYTYEFTNNGDDVPTDEDINKIRFGEPYSYMHFQILKKAIELFIGYRRWKNDLR